MDNCIFCKIANKDIPGKIIYEDDLCLAFLDLSQATYGHTLVIPKKHYANILEADDETVAHLFTVAKKLSADIMEKCHATGLNILINTHEIAGQSVYHFHIHILPRYEKEELTIEFTDHSDQINLNEVYEKIMK